MHQSDDDASTSDEDRPRRVFDRGYLRTSEREIRPATPETTVTEYTAKPDISVFCEKCSIFIDIKSLREHRAYHKALETLKYKGDNRPENVEELMRRRRLVLRQLKKQMNSENVLHPRLIGTVNDAYEFLKSELEDTLEVSRNVAHDNVRIAEEGVGVGCSANCVLAIGLCSDRNARWKQTMEDVNVLQDAFGDDDERVFCGVYDGHNGIYAAEIVAQELHRVLLKEMSKFDLNVKADDTLNMSLISDALEEEIKTARSACLDSPDGQNNTARTNRMSKAFRQAYLKTDRYFLSLGKDEQSRVRWSGCSACTVVVENRCHDDDQLAKLVDYKPKEIGEDYEPVKPEPPEELGMIHLANAGHVEAVLVRGNRAHKISKDHTPRNTRERERILKAGGSVNESEVDQRVNGILSATRGLGNHGDIQLKKCIIPTPYTCSVRVDQYAQFLIVATRGVWEILSEHEAASLLTQFLCKGVREMLPCNAIFDPSRPSTSVNLLLAEYNSQVHAATSLGAYQDEDGGTSIATRANTIRDEVPGRKSQQKLTFAENELDRGRSEVNQAGRESDVLSAKLWHESPGNDRVQTGKSMGSTRYNVRIAEHEYITEDLQTEIVSNTDRMSGSSGHEGDVETMTEFLSIPAHSRMSSALPSREEIRQEIGKLMAERLVQAAMLAGAKDNITAVVILFPGSKL